MIECFCILIYVHFNAWSTKIEIIIDRIILIFKNPQVVTAM